MEYQFKTTLNYKDIDLEHVPDPTIIDHATVEVTWCVSLEIRDWGVKDISAYAIDVDVKVIDEDGNDMLPSHMGEWKIDSDIDTKDGSIMVTYALINLKTKSIFIS